MRENEIRILRTEPITTITKILHLCYWFFNKWHAVHKAAFICQHLSKK